MSKSIKKQTHVPGSPRKVTPYKRHKVIVNDFDLTYIKINRDPKVFF